MSDSEIVNFIEDIKQETGVDIRLKTRERKYVYSRAVFFEIVKKKNPNITLAKMGSFVNMHHTTVIHWMNSRINLDVYEDFYDIKKAIKSIRIEKYAKPLIFCNPIPYLNGQN